MINNNILKVSVVIPVYNVENFLDETINSVLNQSFNDIEIILIDDGSTDDSPKICEKYTINNPRVKLILQKNQGVSVARNRGIAEAKGAYIFFMDSDDTIDSDFIKTSYEIAKQNNSDIVVVGDYFKKRLLHLTALPTCAQFIKHEILKTYAHIRFPKNIQPCEDGLFSHQLLRVTNRISFNSNGIYHYRKHENQNHFTINKNVDKVLQQIPKWLEILDCFYTQHKLYKTHSLHLALFIQHEPFNFRYVKMPLNGEQKIFLHKIIKDFMNQNVLPNLAKKELRELSSVFMKFIKVQNYQAFESYFNNSVFNRNNKVRNKICIKLAKLIVNTKTRKRLMHYLQGEF